jgi:hypothetical protein
LNEITTLRKPTEEACRNTSLSNEKECRDVNALLNSMAFTEQSIKIMAHFSGVLEAYGEFNQARKTENGDCVLIRHRRIRSAFQPQDPHIFLRIIFEKHRLREENDRHHGCLSLHGSFNHDAGRDQEHA